LTKGTDGCAAAQLTPAIRRSEPKTDVGTDRQKATAKTKALIRNELKSLMEFSPFVLGSAPQTDDFQMKHLAPMAVSGDVTPRIDEIERSIGRAHAVKELPWPFGLALETRSIR
jgi:hypothetical protein